MIRNRLRDRARDQRGFTLVETVSAMFILLVGVLATAQIIDASSSANAANRQRDGATNLARELVEAARGVPYEQVVGDRRDHRAAGDPRPRGHSPGPAT